MSEPKLNAGWAEARRLVPLGPCEDCGVPGRDRHHRDGNPLNNVRANIAVLCRRCHMQSDGRLERLRVRVVPVRPPRACVNCGQLHKPSRRGRCEPCASFFYSHGSERPGAFWDAAKRRDASRQRVLELCAEGLSYAETGRRLGLPSTTVARYATAGDAA